MQQIKLTPVSFWAQVKIASCSVAYHIEVHPGFPSWRPSPLHSWQVTWDAPSDSDTCKTTTDKPTDWLIQCIQQLYTESRIPDILGYSSSKNCPISLSFFSDEVLVWLSVWSEVQIVCIWSSWCHCIPKAHHLLPHLNPDWFYLSGTGIPRLSLKRGR